MNKRLYPPCPLFTKLCMEEGSETVLDKYFDVDGEVIGDAPQQLKDEIEMIRYGDIDDDGNWYLPENHRQRLE